MPRPVRSAVFRPVGAVPPAVVAAVASRVSRTLVVPCRTGPPLDLPAAGDVPGRDQWDADRLLEAAEAAAAGSAGELLVALVSRDMGNPVFTHFFGRARLGGAALVVSIARLAEPPAADAQGREALVRRAAAEVLHEAGHVAGLGHCPEPRCLLRLARNVDAIDVRGFAFCPRCASAMPGLVRAPAG